MPFSSRYDISLSSSRLLAGEGEILGDCRADRVIHLRAHLSLHSPPEDEHDCEVDEKDSEDPSVEVPRTEQGLTLRVVGRVLSLFKHFVYRLWRQQAFKLFIAEGLNLPRDLALIRSLSIGIADGESKVHSCRIGKRAIIDGDTWVQLYVVQVGPFAVIAQDAIVSLMVFSDGKGLLNALVDRADFFSPLNHHSAPVVALVERLLHRVVLIRIHEALVNVAKECPEEVSLIFVLVTH